MNFEEHTVRDLIISLEAELAKGLSEIRHAQADLDKADNRYKFVLALIHYIKKDMKI
jgi:hypothetical protein